MKINTSWKFHCDTEIVKESDTVSLANFERPYGIFLKKL